MSSIITLTAQEAQDNFDFVFSLVERGHTIKLISESGHIVLMTPIATPNQGSKINIPDPEEFVPDPAFVAGYVSESLDEMTQDF